MLQRKRMTRKQLIKMYMDCKKRTLAKMLAERDLHDQDNPPQPHPLQIWQWPASDSAAGLTPANGQLVGNAKDKKHEVLIDGRTYFIGNAKVTGADILSILKLAGRPPKKCYLTMITDDGTLCRIRPDDMVTLPETGVTQFET